ncbi:MAG: hypothetical protein J6336_10975 [Kiritimatiellae bacterium]|nr:hypothetical protein [Kiritimatiellia bacterium]
MKPKPANRNGATLIVTLGVLTLLATLAVSFLMATRIRQRSTRAQRTHQMTRDAMDAAMQHIVRQIEDAMISANCSEETTGETKTTGRRLVPVNRWFNDAYLGTNDVAEENEVLPQIGGRVFLSLAEKGHEDQTVNLLTPEVLALLPNALTNGLPKTGRNENPLFRSGWQNLPGEREEYVSELAIALQYRACRVAYAIFNASDLYDVNTFLSGPTPEKTARTCFFPSDVSNWVERASVTEDLLDRGVAIDPDDLPFSTFSYDPNPGLIPFVFSTLMPSETFGTFAFGVGQPLDLNMQGAYQVASDYSKLLPVLKFNINAITNYFPDRDGNLPGDAATDWYDNSNFRAFWLDPVSKLIDFIPKGNDAGRHTLPQGSWLAWSIANWMDPDRVPQVSTFAADEGGVQILPTRVAYAIEDVPMINKVSVFNLFDEEGKPRNDLPDGVKFKDYKVGEDVSNHYAVAVEVWYPFMPQDPLRDEYHGDLNPSCYVGFYDNADDIQTTQPRPWSSNLMRDWFRWNYVASSNTVYQTLFKNWGEIYLQTMGESIWQHPLWKRVTHKSDLWFTTSQVRHPYWPQADTNGLYDITQTVIWQSFYPETYEVVSTNYFREVVEEREDETSVTNRVEVLPDEPGFADAVEVVTTNVFTTMNLTNNFIDWASEEGVTNRLIGVDPLVTIWQTPEGTVVTNTTVNYDVSGGRERLDEWLMDNEAYTNTPLGVAQFRTIWERPDGLLMTNDWAGFTAADSDDPLIYSDDFKLVDLFRDEADDSVWAVSGTTNETGEAVLITNRIEGLVFSENDSDNVWVITTNDVAYSQEILPIEPLPMTDYLETMLTAIMTTLPTNNIQDLNEQLLMTPEDLDDWTRLFDGLSADPNLMNRLLTEISKPSLGNLTEENRYELTRHSSEKNKANTGVVIMEDDAPGDGDNFKGYFWTVYPYQTISFPEEYQDLVTGEVKTNWWPIGSSGGGSTHTVWVRPLVTLNPDRNRPDDHDDDALVEDNGDIIVDEALLTGSSTSDNNASVFAWTVATNKYVPDPRRNAFANDWVNMPSGASWKEPYIHSTNLTAIAELPFIQTDEPFATVGDIGHVYASYAVRKTDEGDAWRHSYDTVTFSTRSGAALLDIFTTITNNAPSRGRIQANTQYDKALDILFSNMTAGWTNVMDGSVSDTLIDFREEADVREAWVDLYTNVLGSAKDNMGWRSYADLMPALLNVSTNSEVNADSPWEGVSDLVKLHDYSEDAVRRLPEFLSFRQSIYHVVLAVQALSPRSTDDRPIPIAEQRALVTLYRDTYTGRWTVVTWRWL